MEHVEAEEIAKYERVVYGYCAPVFYVLGVFGCTANLLTLPKKKFSARLYFYLRSLSLSDLIYLLLVIPLLTRVVQSQNTNPYSDDFHAKFYRIYIELELVNGFFTASVFIIVSMTIDRYFAICHPLKYAKSRKYINPRIYVLLSFFCGLVLHIPHCFEKTIEPVNCLELVENATTNAKENKPICWCFDTEEGSLVCSYHGHDIQGLHQSIIWKTYVILCELMVRFIPTFLLIGLNVAMIRHFNRVISSNILVHEDKIRRASVPLPTICIFSVTSQINDEKCQKKEPSFLMEPRLKLAASLSSLTTASATSFIHSTKGKAGRKPFEKEKNVIVTLVLITVMFTIGTVPIGIARVVRNFNPDFVTNVTFAKFRIIANLMEICNASINFYLYCLFNSDIRENVRKTIKSTFRLKKK